MVDSARVDSWKRFYETWLNSVPLLSQGDYSKTCFQSLSSLTSLASSWKQRSHGGE